jgi:hypothetical protein
MQNDGGANCFIFNNPKVLWILQYTPLSVRKLDDTSISAQGYGVIIIRPANSNRMFALRPSYYFPANPHNTFSPKAIKNYLLLPSVVTNHTIYLSITLASSVALHFQALPNIVESSGLDFFTANIIHPPVSTSPLIPPPVVNYSKAPLVTRALLHQHLGHIYDDVLETRCRKQTLIGLPCIPPPHYDYDCPIAVLPR